MTTLVLGTQFNQKKVYEVARETGFTLTYAQFGPTLPYHNKIDHLSLKINKPSFYKSIKEIITEIGFNYFANEECAFKVLGELEQKLPGLLCHQIYLGKNPTEIKKVNDFLDSITPQ